MLNSALSYFRYGRTDQRKLQLLFSYLTSRFSYAEAEEGATVYSLLCQGSGDSRCFASVVRWLCERAELEAYLVCGQRNGEPHYWNIIRLDGAWYHCDFQRDAAAGKGLRFRQDSGMKRYDWDREAYPACVPPEPEESTEPEPTEQP